MGILKSSAYVVAEIIAKTQNDPVPVPVMPPMEDIDDKNTKIFQRFLRGTNESVNS